MYYRQAVKDDYLMFLLREAHFGGKIDDENFHIQLYIDAVGFFIGFFNFDVSDR